MVAILYMTVFCAVSPIGEFWSQRDQHCCHLDQHCNQNHYDIFEGFDDDNGRRGCGDGTDEPGRGGGDGNECTRCAPGHQHCDCDDNVWPLCQGWRWCRCSKNITIMMKNMMTHRREDNHQCKMDDTDAISGFSNREPLLCGLLRDPGEGEAEECERIASGANR